jgi:thymidine kinase
MISVICGPMFAGKTTALIERYQWLTQERIPTRVFKHSFDTRAKDVQTHAGESLPCLALSSVEQLLLQVPPGVGAVLIDEVQFFDESIVDAAVALSRSGVHVIAAGLDLDYRGRDFGPMGHLLAVADDVTKVRASCAHCGLQASRTGRKVDSQLTVLVGGHDQYEARCLNCWLDRSVQ